MSEWRISIFCGFLRRNVEIAKDATHCLCGVPLERRMLPPEAADEVGRDAGRENLDVDVIRLPNHDPSEPSS